MQTDTSKIEFVIIKWIVQDSDRINFEDKK